MPRTENTTLALNKLVTTHHPWMRVLQHAHWMNSLGEDWSSGCSMNTCLYKCHAKWIPRSKRQARIAGCPLDWMCVCPQRSYVEVLTPTVMVFGGAVSGRWLGYEGGTLMNGISALVRRDTAERLSLSLHHGRTQQEGGHLQVRKRTFIRNQISQHLDLRIPSL